MGVERGTTPTVMFVLAITCLPSIFGKPRLVVPGSAALEYAPLIDGHNDFPYKLYAYENNELGDFNFEEDLTKNPKWGPKSHTDLPRLRKGKVGAQFWAAYVGCTDTQYKDAVERTLEQIDVIHRLVEKYPKDLQLATSPQSIWEAFNAKRIASLIGVEGGHSIDSRLAVLRQFYTLGVRYMTLTHSCNTPWANSSTTDTNQIVNLDGFGLSTFGENVVLEMNRLGMMVDLSHVSYTVMKHALSITKAPVIFSHSSVYQLCNNARNVRDDIIDGVKANKGLIMVNFYTSFIQSSPGKGATLEDVVDHINYIRERAGVDHVGLGGDYDGVDSVPVGLEDVSKYPDLFDRLATKVKEGDIVWTQDELEKLAGRNLLRVFQAVEKVRDDMKASNVLPYDKSIPRADLIAVNDNKTDVGACRTDLQRHLFFATPQTTIMS